MRLADFILSNNESILVEWERFAATLLPAAVSMTQLALRNEAKEILEAVATDLSTAQTRQAQIDKSLGRAPKVMDAPETAAQTRAIAGAERFRHQAAGLRIPRPARQRPSPVDRIMSG
jgi:hypothetical protein